MRVETTYRHLFAAGTLRGCPCCLRVDSKIKRQERRMERRQANRDARELTREVENEKEP